ncbi:hypothetical protein KJ765_01760 [Candidatus Micrarchaeota archaeon]|nr:hypothetical protein [Candidatus Micrarchaeota archaeon]
MKKRKKSVRKARIQHQRADSYAAPSGGRAFMSHRLKVFLVLELLAVSVLVAIAFGYF